MAFKQSRNDQVVAWINSVMEEEKLESGKDAEYLHSQLSTGVLLCEFMNKIEPNSVKAKLMKQRVGMNIFDMQRVAAFLRAAKKLGLSGFAAFEDTDMRDANMSKIVNGLYSFGNLCHSKNIANGGIVGSSKKGKKRTSKIMKKPAIAPTKETSDDHKASPVKPANSSPSKISGLAAKININPMGLKGGIPPSLQSFEIILFVYIYMSPYIYLYTLYTEKREQQNEESNELPTSDFERPVIPSDARKKIGNRKNIMSVTNEEVNESLKICLNECFKFDERMIVNEDYLCLYLRDVKGIDLSLSGDVKDEKWDKNILIDATKAVFGDQVYNEWGYLLKLI